MINLLNEHINYIFLGCRLGFFGNDCKSACGKCLNGVCDHVTGRCAAGCKPGWTGSNCLESESFQYMSLRSRIKQNSEAQESIDSIISYVFSHVSE